MDEANVGAEQDRLRGDAETIVQYAVNEALEQFGGCYWHNNPPVHLVTLFTDDVERHRATLERRVVHPDRLDIRRCARSKQQVEQDNEEITATLLGRPELKAQLASVGIEMGEGNLIVRVGVHPSSADLAGRIIELVYPRPVIVEEEGFAVPLSAVLPPEDGRRRRPPAGPALSS
jgi:hypothetical protein